MVILVWITVVILELLVGQHRVAEDRRTVLVPAAHHRDVLLASVKYDSSNK